VRCLVGKRFFEGSYNLKNPKIIHILTDVSQVLGSFLGDCDFSVWFWVYGCAFLSTLTLHFLNSWKRGDESFTTSLKNS
jgi:hypothetical protein